MSGASFPFTTGLSRRPREASPRRAAPAAGGLWGLGLAFVALVTIPVSLGAQEALRESSNAYQLEVDHTASGPRLRLWTGGNRVLERGISPALAPQASLAASMTPDGRRVAFLLRDDSAAHAELWIGGLLEEHLGDRLLVSLDLAAEAVEAFHWSPTGDRLAYSLHRRAEDGEEAIPRTEIWIEPVDDGAPWLAFTAGELFHFLGWTDEAQLQLIGPDGTLAIYDLETFELRFPAGDRSAAPQTAVTEVGAKILAQNADVRMNMSDVPASIAPGETKAVRVRVTNTGGSTWTRAALHRLGARWNGSTNQVTWGGYACGGYMSSPTDGRVFLCSGQSIGPGASVDFNFSITAPGNASGSTRFGVQMVQDAVEWFGEAVTWTIPVSGGGCPNSSLAVPSDRWRLQIWNNRFLSGSTVETRYDAVGSGGFAFDWGGGHASNCTGNDNYSLRFRRNAHFPSSTTYTFTTRTDDGVRLWVDGVLILDRWIDQAPTTYTVQRWLAAGWHSLKMEYYENGGGAVAELSWTSGGGGACPAGQYDLAEYVLGTQGTQPDRQVVTRNTAGNQEYFAFVDGGNVGSLKRIFFVKNTSGENWEEFGRDANFIYRYRDTSWTATCDGPGQNHAEAYYSVTDNNRTSFAKWAPRCMSPGQSWISDVGSWVEAYFEKEQSCSAACSNVYEGPTTQRTTFVAYHPTYVTLWGLQINDVIELYTASSNDRFFYAKGWGLVAFEGNGIATMGATELRSGQPAPPRQTVCGQ